MRIKDSHPAKVLRGPRQVGKTSLLEGIDTCQLKGPLRLGIEHKSAFSSMINASDLAKNTGVETVCE
jgi:predicted AAA+ superfamily ATPase